MTRKRFSLVNNAQAASFAYTPPDQAYGSARILIKPNLISRPETPGVVSPLVLSSVLRGLRRAAPMARLVIVEQGYGALTSSQVFEQYGIESLIDAETRLGDIDTMVMAEYATSGAPFTAPEAVMDYDCVISITALGITPDTLISGSLHNLIGFLPQTLYPARALFLDHDHLRLVAEAFGPHVDGVVVTVDERVVWGDDMLAVDAAACRMAGVSGEGPST